MSSLPYYELKVKRERKARAVKARAALAAKNQAIVERNKGFLTVPQVARIYRVSTADIWRWRRKGLCARIDAGRVFLLKKDVEAWILFSRPVENGPPPSGDDVAARSAVRMIRDNPKTVFSRQDAQERAPGVNL
jgi:hypothetical protein